MSKPMRAALYLRVSTDKQTTENQRVELEAAAATRGWAVVETYQDNGISGAKGRDKRPGLDRMLKDAVRRKFDVVMVWAVDRLGRSLLDLIDTMQELKGAKVNMFIQKSGIDTTTPGGKAMYQMLGVFGEFERDMIVDRVKAGIERANAERKAGIERAHKDGRKKKAHGRPRSAVEKQIRERLAAGESIRSVIRETGAGSGTVQRVKRETETAH
jgi:DNA invertase Pin-like site-specific DNA recombinase